MRRTFENRKTNKMVLERFLTLVGEFQALTMAHALTS